MLAIHHGTAPTGQLLSAAHFVKEGMGGVGLGVPRLFLLMLGSCAIISVSEHGLEGGASKTQDSRLTKTGCAWTTCTS